MELLDRARRYIDKCPPAIAGQGGHDATYRVAAALVNGFALHRADAEQLLAEWNLSHCQPPWTERDLAHKLDDAERGPHENPRGYLLRELERNSLARSNPGPRPAAKAAPSATKSAAASYDTAAAPPLPPPLPDPTTALLRAAFRPGERVRIVPACFTEDEREIPQGDGLTMPLEYWLKKLAEHGGNANGLFEQQSGAGIYIGCNPLGEGGTRDADVTAYRHALVEFDTLPLPQQFDLIRQSQVPVCAVIYSGGKSVHAWVRVDASSREEYDARVKVLCDHFAGAVDPKNKNPARLSRLPGCRRGAKRQELLALGIGAANWGEWASTIGSGLPPIEDVSDIVDDVEAGRVPLPPVLVDGVLHKGHKLALGGPSKTNKTWCLMALANAVATGGKWMGRNCRQGRVLYLNFEIDRAHMKHRLQKVVRAAGKDGANGPKPDEDAFHLWNLRGHPTGWMDILPTVTSAIRTGDFALVVIDPFYKMLGDQKENEAGDIAKILNELESLCRHTGAAVAFASHFAKGDASQKSAIDRISGSGVFARDPDSILTLTPHEEDDAFVLDYTLRNFPRLEPIVVRWKYPLMNPDLSMDPRKLKKPGKEPAVTQGRLMEMLAGRSVAAGVLQAELQREGTTVSEETVKRYLKTAVAAGLVVALPQKKGPTLYAPVKTNQPEPEETVSDTPPGDDPF